MEGGARVIRYLPMFGSCLGNPGRIPACSMGSYRARAGKERDFICPPEVPETGPRGQKFCNQIGLDRSLINWLRLECFPDQRVSVIFTAVRSWLWPIPGLSSDQRGDVLRPEFVRLKTSCRRASHIHDDRSRHS